MNSRIRLEKYQGDGKIFPKLDKAIEEAKDLYKPKYAQKALIKAYAQVATGGTYLYSCACSEFSQACILAAEQLAVTPAVVADCFSRVLSEGGKQALKFTVDLKYEDSVPAAVLEYGLSEKSKIRFYTSAGIANLPVYATVEDASAAIGAPITDTFVEDCLFQLPYQVAALAYQLDLLLQGDPSNYALAAARVKDPMNFLPGAWGRAVHQAYNKLRAQGHSKAV